MLEEIYSAFVAKRIAWHLNFDVDLALIKDGLNFDDRPLKANGKLLRLNPRVRREHLFFQLLWETVQLFVSCFSPTYLVDEFISLL